MVDILNAQFAFIGGEASHIYVHNFLKQYNKFHLKIFQGDNMKRERERSNFESRFMKTD